MGRLLFHRAVADEDAVRLMKDDLVNPIVLSAKFDGKTVQLDDPKPAALLRLETIGGLEIGLQDQPAFGVETHVVVHATALEKPGASLAKRRIYTLAGGAACEHD